MITIGGEIGHIGGKNSTLEEFETKEIKIGGTNEKFVTAESGVDVGDMVVLNPRKHLNKMEIPEIEEADDRDKLAKIASEPRPVVKDSGRPEGGPSAGGGGMNPEAIVGMIMGRVDTNSDGKISKDEASADENMKKFFDESDSNKESKEQLSRPACLGCRGSQHSTTPSLLPQANNSLTGLNSQQLFSTFGIVLREVLKQPCSKLNRNISSLQKRRNECWFIEKHNEKQLCTYLEPTK
jgi:hypothetical protein